MAKKNSSTNAKKKAVIVSDPPAALGRQIAEHLATQHTNVPAGFQEEVDKSPAPDPEPMTLTLPPLPPVAELIQETPRYFISATISFFLNGYQRIDVAGIRVLNGEGLDHIDGLIIPFFEAQIYAAGTKLVADWSGLPPNATLTINTINRL